MALDAVQLQGYRLAHQKGARLFSKLINAPAQEFDWTVCATHESISGGPPGSVDNSFHVKGFCVFTGTHLCRWAGEFGPFLVAA